MWTLNQRLTAEILRGRVSFAIPSAVRNNLNPGFELRPYQIEALARFIRYHKESRGQKAPRQLLFHMATGSGKTLIMAAIILYLYRQGYRNFIFFVNSSNIIEKTRDNFLNPQSSKYLFNKTISMDGRSISVKETDAFDASDENNINIVFSTIQGLHNRLNTPKENGLTYEDLKDKKIVMISDEAHHINAETRKGRPSKGDWERLVSWEGTVRKIFRANPENLLLEFTATADLSHPEIAGKYRDKLLFDYPLKQFRKDGYSKEVQLLQADLPPFERALQALVLSQYRQKVFAAYGLAVKAVVLFKSKSIKESLRFSEEFTRKLRRLEPALLHRLRAGNANGVLGRAFRYFGERGISAENLILELQTEFSPEKCISVNSRNDSEAKQLIVNTLEDESNPYRIVFAVDKLNEGWDVLNLFDIVRLYNTRDGGKTTRSEAQLIGRGARYCPFRISDDQPPDRRKYDGQRHELRICEELYYHAAHNPRYIADLNKALREIGIKAKKNERINVTLKERFKNKDFYRSGFIFLNKRLVNDSSKIFEMDAAVRNKIYKAELRGGDVVVAKAFAPEPPQSFPKEKRLLQLNAFSVPSIRKAMSKLPFYRFDNLRTFFPHLSTVSEFISSEKYLKSIAVEVKGAAGRTHNLTPQAQLEIVLKVLDQIAELIVRSQTKYRGGKEFLPQPVSAVFKDGERSISAGENNASSEGENSAADYVQEEWYVLNEAYGPQEEASFLNYFRNIYPSLKKNYEEIYLIKNANYFKLFSFSGGRPVTPAFVLFLIKGMKIRQIFIPVQTLSGSARGQWQVDFLRRIEKRYNTEIASKKFKVSISALPPFLPTGKGRIFDSAFRELLASPF